MINCKIKCIKTSVRQTTENLVFSRHYHSMESFSHYDIIDKHGNRIAEGHKASFCLEDSSCERGVFPKYNCQGFGHQGE